MSSFVQLQVIIFIDFAIGEIHLFLFFDHAGNLRYSLDSHLLAFLVFRVFIFFAQQLVLAREDNLRIEVLAVSSHLDDILVELYLFLAVRYLVHAPIEDEHNTVRLVFDSLCLLLDSPFEELVVSLPELPQQIGVAILSLLYLGLIFDLSLNQHIELVQLIDVHPYLSSCVMHFDLARDDLPLFILRLWTSSFFDHRRLDGHSCEESGTFVLVRSFDLKKFCNIIRKFLSLVQSTVEGADQA